MDGGQGKKKHQDWSLNMKQQKKMIASEGDEAAPTSEKSQAVITDNTSQKKEAT